jgi:tRNA(fMet)-specific endonuclease VapC
MRYLLDTNILSDLVRNPQGRVAECIREVGEAQVCNQHHRHGGTALRGSEKGITASLGTARGGTGALEILPFEAPAGAIYGRLRTRLERAGQPIGGNDLLIAAQAVALGHAIVTDNERGLARIEGLQRENWLR